MVAPRNAAYAEESAEVEVLYANLEKLKLLTKKIQGSLNRLETGGNVVKHAIGPIYSNTQSLQITNSNIDKVNEAIERLRQPLDAKGKEEGIIRSRYAASSRVRANSGKVWLTSVQPPDRRFVAIPLCCEARGKGLGRPQLNQFTIEPKSYFRIYFFAGAWKLPAPGHAPRHTERLR